MKLLQELVNSLIEAEHTELKKVSDVEAGDLIQPDDKDTKGDSEVDSEVDSDDVGSIVSRLGFEKSFKEMFAFGETRKVTVLTKSETLGGLDITYQYLINAKTGSWTLRACLKGQSDADMVEFTTGEDSDSLIRSLKKSPRISHQAAVDNLNPPADGSLDDDSEDFKGDAD